MSVPQVADYRPGDIETPLGPLRLTLGALAEIIQIFEADTPCDLADKLRRIRPDEARQLLRALLRPCGNAPAVEALSDQDVARLMPAIARTITTAFEKQE